MTRTIRKKHSLVMRWTHWINFPILAIMIWSGLLIYWANDEYSIKLFGHNYYQFFPAGFYTALNVPHRLAEGMALHFFFMWLFFLNGFFYILYTAISGEWRQLFPNRRSFREAWQVVLHDLHIRRIAPPQDKYNAAQRIAYTSILFMGAGSLITGLAIYKPVQFYWLTWICGGYHAARVEHFILTVGYILFFLIHVVQVILAGWHNFKPAITGFETLKNKKDDTVSTRPVKEVSDRFVNRRNFISFATFAGLGFLGFKSWQWLNKSPIEPRGITGNARLPLRRALNQNEKIFAETFSNDHLVKTYPKSMAARNVRVNSSVGIEDRSYNTAAWSLMVTRIDGSLLKVSMSELLAMPKTEIVYDFKCVEGWDQISWWGGVKFSDFIERFGLQEEAKLGYVGLATPDQRYYVGLEKAAVMHPQTLLAYQVNGQFLPYEHGQPLRLIIPVKYGIKNLKRIGSMTFSSERPRDYWAERGYDYYSGL